MSNHSEIYNEGYARTYIESTLSSSYTGYKNKTIAEIAFAAGTPTVVDLGGNVSGIIKRPGSLRYQLEARGVDYIELDLSRSYFNLELANRLGVPESEIYPTVMGVQGSITELPFKSNSLDFAVCADVIEHIEEPGKALKEIQGTLKKGGALVIVIPSLYKLDAVQFPHIDVRRASSHENKLSLSDWITLCENAGFTVQQEGSRPLGIASGAAYLAWLQDIFVPERASVDSEETFNPNARRFKSVKNLIGKYDDRIDDMILSDPMRLEKLMEAYKIGHIEQVWSIVLGCVASVATPEDLSSISQFFASIDFAEFDPLRIRHLTSMISDNNQHVDDNAFLGNSALLLLTKD